MIESMCMQEEEDNNVSDVSVSHAMSAMRKMILVITTSDCDTKKSSNEKNRSGKEGKAK